MLNQGDSVLAELKRKVLNLQHLNTLLAEYLDKPVLEHVQIAAVHDEAQEHGDKPGNHSGNDLRDTRQLVLTADSPVWGHRVRYLAPAILEFLHSRGELKHIHSTRIMIRPAFVSFTDRDIHQHEAKAISERSAQLLLQVANEIDNPELAKPLRRLSQRGRPS